MRIRHQLCQNNNLTKVALSGDDDDDGELGLANGDAAASRIEVVDIGPIIKQTAVSEMEAGIEAVSNELSKLRTGRASPGACFYYLFGCSLNIQERYDCLFSFFFCRNA